MESAAKSKSWRPSWRKKKDPTSLKRASESQNIDWFSTESQRFLTKHTIRGPREHGLAWESHTSWDVSLHGGTHATSRSTLQNSSWMYYESGLNKWAQKWIWFQKAQVYHLQVWGSRKNSRNRTKKRMRQWVQWEDLSWLPGLAWG